jgi:hypothetical protein
LAPEWQTTWFCTDGAAPVTVFHPNWYAHTNGPNSNRNGEKFSTAATSWSRSMRGFAPPNGSPPIVVRSLGTTQCAASMRYRLPAASRAAMPDVQFRLALT